MYAIKITTGSMTNLPIKDYRFECISIKTEVTEVPNIAGRSEPGKPILKAIDNSDKRKIKLTLTLSTGQNKILYFLMDVSVAEEFMKYLDDVSTRGYYNFSRFMKYSYIEEDKNNMVNKYGL